MMLSNPIAVGKYTSKLLAWAAGRQVFDARALPVYLAIAALTATNLTCGSLLSFTIDRTFLFDDLIVFGFFVSVAGAARWIGFSRPAGTVEAFILFTLASALAVIASIIAAAANRPLADGLLASADANIIGLTHASFGNALARLPGAPSALPVMYQSFGFQPLFLLPTLFVMHEEDRAWHFVFAWCLAMIACVAVSAFVPAHSNPPYLPGWIEVFDGARSGTLRHLDHSVMTGIITFPSFHAAGAVVLAWGWSRVRIARRPMVALNAAVIVSAIPVGGHYVVDVVAGGAIAAIAIWMTPRLCSLSNARSHGSAEPGA